MNGIRRHPILLEGDPGRVLVRPFMPGGLERGARIVRRVASLSDDQASRQLEETRASYGERHSDLDASIERRAAEVTRQLEAIGDDVDTLTPTKRSLLGAYFLMEYALECAALFNPSIVEHPDQSGAPAGAARYIMSLRAVGEGHLSSIVFRTVLVYDGGEVVIEPAPEHVSASLHVPDAFFDRALFGQKLVEMGIDRVGVWHVLDAMPSKFMLNELAARVADVTLAGGADEQNVCARAMTLARSNAHLRCTADSLAGCALFPFSESTSRGMEDARFVRFVEDEGGEVRFYATFTAYDGHTIYPQLLETRDFRAFHVTTLNGTQVQNKGMALFPRRINGEYVMLSRQDGERLFLMRSEHLHFWNEKVELALPEETWEFVQIGNCGSPIETERGWLVLTHGVGPMRQYAIGAMLLDIDHPERVIAKLVEPLIEPLPSQRDGYVPNVVYTCGAALHGDDLLVIPFAVADSATSVATCSLTWLLDTMTPINA